MPFDLFFLSSLGLLPYCALGLLVMAEGPIATLMGGAAASSGALLPVPVYLSVVLGNLTADIGWYSLGRFCKPDWLIRLSKKVGLDIRKVEKLERLVQKYAPRLLFLAKLTVGFPIPTLVATGISRVPVRRWVGMLVLGELIKSAVLIFVGYLYARTVQLASAGIQVILWVFTAALIAAGLVWYKRRKKNGIGISNLQ